MWKGILVFAICFAIVLSVLVLLQPSSQESALEALNAADKVLGGITSPTTPADQVKLTAQIAETQAAIKKAKENLSASTAMERIRSIKDQILALVWPIVVAILVLYLLSSGSALRLFGQLGSIVSNVKIPGGLEIAFASTTIKNTQEEVLRSYRQQVIAQYDAVATQSEISATVDRILKERIRPYLQQYGLTSDFRCTIHVKDILFQDSLYQLIDYLPRTWIGSAQGGGRGRAWSVRYGMMGRCWRLEKDEFLGSVPKDERRLVNDWGMTKTEAEDAPGGETLFCLLIRAKNQNPLAIFYLDAKPREAFGDESRMQDFGRTVAQATKDYNLDVALEKVWDRVQSSAPLIEIYARRK